MDSRNGNAMVTPAPRKKVRRDKCFFVMTIMTSSGRFHRYSQFLLYFHLERRAFDYSQNQRRKTIIAASRVLNDRSHGRHIVILHSAARTISQKHLSHRPDKLIRVAQ